MSRRSYTDDLEVPEMSVFPEVPNDTVEVLTKYLLSVKKADAQPAPVEVKEPTVGDILKEEIQEIPETQNSIPVSWVIKLNGLFRTSSIWARYS